MKTFDASNGTCSSHFLRRLDHTMRLTGFLLFSLMIATPPQLVLAQQTTIEIDPTTPTDLGEIGPLELDIDLDGSGGEPPIVVESCTSSPLLLFYNDKCISPFIDDDLSTPPIFDGPISSTDFEVAAAALLENPAIDDVLNNHQLSVDDIPMVLDYARDSVRAAMFTRLLTLIKKSTSWTFEEQTLIDYFSYFVKERRLFAAAYSVKQYEGWYQGACAGWQPPEPFSYDPGATCGGHLGGYFSGGPQPPSYDEFIAYGITLAYKETNTNPLVVAATIKTARSIGLLTAGASLGIVGGTIAGLAGGGSALAAALFPHAVMAGTLGTVGTAAIAGAVGIAVMALVMVAVRIFQVYETSSIPHELLVNFQNRILETVDLSALVDSQKGIQELYSVFIEKTATRDRFTLAVPAPLQTDAKFRIKDADGNIISSAAPMIDFWSWDVSEASPQNPKWKARLSGGWFVIETTSIEGDNPVETLTLGLPYIRWGGERWIAWRRGTQFIHTPIDNTSTPSFISDEIKFFKLDEMGAPVALSASVFVDDTPPALRGVIDVTGQEGDNGWIRGSVTLSWDPKDDESAITLIEGCETQIVNDDTDSSGKTFSCKATSQGGTASESVTIKVDKTSPTITSTRSPSANGSGWNNAPVTVHFSCDDAQPGSGMASCEPAEDTVTGEGANQSVTGTAKDQAGNTASQKVENINIDLTAPGITGTFAPAANEAGWNSSDVTVSFSCADTLSGVASCASDQVLSGEGTGLSVVGHATDKAGNANTTTVTGIQIDKTPPAITGVALPAANEAGWNNSDVTVSFSCADTLSGVASCASDQVLSGEGTGLSAIGHATDKAGNANTTTVTGIQIDKTPPEVTINVPMNGAEYILGEEIVANWEVADKSEVQQPSGVDPQRLTFTADNEARIDTASAGEKSFQVTAYDLAGNGTTLSHGYTVLSPARATERLMDLVTTAALSNGQTTSLKQKLQNAIDSASRGNVNAAAGQITAFINAVEAQKGKRIDVATAEQLIREANKILAALSRL